MERIVKKLKKRMAYVLLDAPAGLGPGVRALLPASDHALVVTTPDDVAMRDAERAIALAEAAGLPRPMLVVNRVRPDMVARGEMYSPQAVASTLDVPLLGFVPEDRAVLAAARGMRASWTGMGLRRRPWSGLPSGFWASLCRCRRWSGRGAGGNGEGILA